MFSLPGITTGMFPDPMKLPTPIPVNMEIPIKNIDKDIMNKIRDKKRIILFLSNTVDINNIMPVIINIGILPTYIWNIFGKKDISPAFIEDVLVMVISFNGNIYRLVEYSILDEKPYIVHHGRVRDRILRETTNSGRSKNFFI